MATNLPYTLQVLQDRINTIVANDADTPASDDDEWATRLNLIHQAIANWESQDVFWNELWTTETTGTISTSTTYPLANEDFRFAGGFLRLTLNDSTSYIPIIKPSEARTYIDGGGKAAYFTGNNVEGRTLNLTWTPTTGDGTLGATISFDYYKYAEKPSGVSDGIEMSDPNYIIYWVAAQKSILESQNNKFSLFDGMATESMDNMRVMNDLLPEYQNGVVQNTDSFNGAILGE